MIAVYLNKIQEYNDFFTAGNDKLSNLVFYFYLFYLNLKDSDSLSEQAALPQHLPPCIPGPQVDTSQLHARVKRATESAHQTT